jgi:hypothetical protein
MFCQILTRALFQVLEIGLLRGLREMSRCLLGYYNQLCIHSMLSVTVSCRVLPFCLIGGCTVLQYTFYFISWKFGLSQGSCIYF